MCPCWNIIFTFLVIFLKESRSVERTSEPSARIQELSSGNYTAFKNSDVCFMLYQSPECKYCKHFYPEYTAAFEMIKRNDTLAHIDFYVINCQQSADVCDREDIKVYPTVKLFFEGNIKDIFDNQATARDDLVLVAYKYGYTTQEITCMKDYDRFFNTEKIILFGYFEKITGLQTAFLRLSILVRNKYKFGHVSKKSILNHVEYFNNVVLHQPRHLHNKFEASNKVYTGPGEVNELIEFINEHQHGLVGHRTRDNMEDFPFPQVVAYYNIDYVHSFKLTNYWRNRILKVALKFRNVTFAMSSKSDFAKDLYHLGINTTEYDNTSPLIFATDSKGIKYMMDVKFSMENYESFVKDFLNNSLKPYVKSEPVPEESDDAVKIIVGKNFDDVIGKEKDTLLEFYTPWCLICLEFAKILEDIALEFGNDEILVAKMDISTNDYPSRFIVKSYPSLYFIPQNSIGNAVLYNGSLSFNDIISFIVEHSTHELKTFDNRGRTKQNTEL